VASRDAGPSLEGPKTAITAMTAATAKSPTPTSLAFLEAAFTANACAKPRNASGTSASLNAARPRHSSIVERQSALAPARWTTGSLTGAYGSATASTIAAQRGTRVAIRSTSVTELSGILAGRRIAHFGHHDPRYSRNRIMAKALVECGAEVTQVADARPFLRRTPNLLGKVVREDFDVILVGFQARRAFPPCSTPSPRSGRMR
jgi:hypothetical protein